MNITEVTIRTSLGLLGWSAMIEHGGKTTGLSGHPTKASALKHARAWCDEVFGRRRWRLKEAP